MYSVLHHVTSVSANESELFKLWIGDIDYVITEGLMFDGMEYVYPRLYQNPAKYILVRLGMSDRTLYSSSAVE